jgi:hypothetical protein
MGAFLILILIVIIFIFLKNNNGGKDTLNSNLEIKKSQLYNCGEKELIDFIRANPKKIRDYFKFAASTGNHRSYTDIFETRDFRIEESFDDDSFKTRIAVIKKSNEKCILYLVG